MSDFNYRYLTDLAKQHGNKVLDYGCGVGRLMAYGLERGLDIHGCDTFSGHYEEWANEAVPAVKDRISKIENGRAPFPDGSFDVVISNQVLEHVDDPEAVIADMGRLLRPGGVLLAAFPVIDTLYEGHVGLYFAHWMKPGRLRHAYFRAARSLGFGLYFTHLPAHEWARVSGDTLDNACRYYPLRRMTTALERVGKRTDISTDYMRTRIPAARRVPSLALRAIYAARAGRIYAVTKSQ